MGIISEAFDEMFDATEVGGGRLEDGKYEGTVTAVAIRDSVRSWVDAELSVTLTTDDGSKAFADIEVSPLTTKDGQLSQGKIKFLKWQLQALGYNGKLSELEYNLESLFGARVTFEVKSEESTKLNPKTGRPYVNRQTVILDNISPGVGADTTPSAPAEAAVY